MTYLSFATFTFGMMKFVLLGLGLFLVSHIFGQQHLQVLLRNGEPAVAYTLQPNQTSVEVYKKFGMEDSMFLKLNQHDTLHVYDDKIIYLAVKNVILDVCKTNDCFELFYLAADKDNFKTIAGLFGHLNPFDIKMLNPQLETITAGMPVLVGYLPAGMLQSSANVEQTNAKVKPVHDSIALQPLYYGSGFYALEYRGVDTATLKGKAANFKSFGGWYDGKFYILVKEYSPGKVVKVTNTQNGQYIFAKVIGPLPDMKSEKKLVARMNNAACAAMDIWDDNDFDVLIEQ
jgi:hypothetical protein